jgi:hypothetical protein
MLALASANQHRSVFRTIARWWQRAAEARPSAVASSELEKVMSSTQAASSAPELLSLSSHGLYGSNLLERRMAALKLEPDEVARAEPELYRDFQRLCTSCRSPIQCAQDLAREFGRDPTEPESSDWRAYCPNGARLNMLSILNRCHQPPASQTPPRSSQLKVAKDSPGTP